MLGRWRPGKNRQDQTQMSDTCQVPPAAPWVLCPEAPGSAEAEAGALAGTAGGQRGRRGQRGRSPAPGVRDGRAPGGGLRGPERERPGRPKDAGSSEWRVEPPFSERRVTEGRTDSPVLHTLDLGCWAFEQHYQAGAAARAWRARECWRSGGSVHPTGAWRGPQAGRHLGSRVLPGGTISRIE